jgi:hypothetical protein
MTNRKVQAVIGFLEETPGSIGQLAAGLTERDLKWKPSSAEFSVLEQVCHLRDLEREGYHVRIRKMLAANQPTLPDFDGSRLARERDYNGQDFEQAIREFARARAENVHVMKTLSPAQLNRSAVLDNVGLITLERLLQLMLEHDESHRKELCDLRERMRAR